MIFKRRVFGNQRAKHLPSGGGLNLNPVHAACKGFEAAPKADLNLVFLAHASSSAFRIRGGDIGRLFIRTPAAFDTALAIAASGGQIDVSPTPRTP